MNHNLAQLGLDDVDDPVKKFFYLGPIDLETLSPPDVKHRPLGRFYSSADCYPARGYYPGVGLFYAPRRWSDKLEEFFLPYGLCEKHVVDLVRLLRTIALMENDHFSKESWALKHAWRAIWYLNGHVASEELLMLLKVATELTFNRTEDTPVTVAVAAYRELPDVLFALGPNALPGIAKAVQMDDCHCLFLAEVALIVQKIAERYPVARERCIKVLTGMLHYDPSKPDTSYSYAAWALLSLKATVKPEVIRIHQVKGLLSAVMGLDNQGIEILTGIRATRDSSSYLQQL